MKQKWLLAVLAILIAFSFGFYFISNPEKDTLDAEVRARLGGTYVKLSDGITHYRWTGPEGGPVVVLVHGGTVPMWVWDNQVPALVAAGFRVLSYDKYGRGYSDRPDVTYDRNLYQKQLLELVNTLGLEEPFGLVGMSLGGATAVNFTASYPDRVRRLVLIAPIINNYKVSSIFGIPLLGDLAVRTFAGRMIVKRFESYIEGSPDAHKYTELFKEQFTYKGFEQSLLSLLRNDALGNYDKAYQAVGKQGRDVLLIWGTDDEEITKEMVNDIQTYIPGITFEPVANAGHGIVVQKPEEVSKLIVNFL